MKAFVIEAPGRTKFIEISQPSPGPEEVLLRIQMVGFCGSDLNTYRGKNPLVSYPRIPGHEIAATIEALGSGVPKAIEPGMDVTVFPYTSCGTCTACRRGRPNACRFNQTLGVQRDGAMTEYLTLPWEKVIPVEGLSFEELCLVEPLSVGFHAVRRGRVTKEDTVVVLGCGTVGLGVVAAAVFYGARTIAVDIDEGKLELVRKVGATETINSASENLHEKLEAFTGGRGPDVVIEAIGLPTTFRAAIEEVAFTGRVVYIGYSNDPVTYETKLFVQKELDILGSRNALLKDFEGVINMLKQARFPVNNFISRVVPFAKAGRALDDWAANPTATRKILVDLRR